VTAAEAPAAAASRTKPLAGLLLLTMLPLFVALGVGVGLALGVRGTDLQVLAGQI
jgi:hypothetical protein